MERSIKIIGEKLRDNEAIHYQKACQAKMPGAGTQEATCMITDDHVVIKNTNQITIDLNCIKKIGITDDCSIFYSSKFNFQSATEIKCSDEIAKHKIKLKLHHPMDAIDFRKAVIKHQVGRFVEMYDKAPPPDRFFDTLADNIPFALSEDSDPREAIYIQLLQNGAPVFLAKKGSMEEKLLNKEADDYYGIIYIPEGPIRWINVYYDQLDVPQRYWFMQNTVNSIIRPEYTEYGIPDHRLEPQMTPIQLRLKHNTGVVSSDRGKDDDSECVMFVSGLIEKAKGEGLISQEQAFNYERIQWTGEDHGTGLAKRLQRDDQLLNYLMTYFNRNPAEFVLQIKSIVDYGFWVISLNSYALPVRPLWDALTLIANHLLNTPVKEADNDK